jgi:subtilase family serine protease
MAMINLTQRMQQHLISPFHKLSAVTLVTTLVCALALTAPFAGAASPKARISAEITSSQMTVLPGSKSPMAKAEYDAGRLPAATRLEGISLYFNRTPQQQAAVEKLIADQQNPSSPSYHQWLTPEQYGARFGMADADIAKVQSWLEQQGFAIDSVARSRNMIRFSGTAAQVEMAFATEMHSYHAVVNTSMGGTKTVEHFAPAERISVPSALAGVVLAVRNLDDNRPRSHVVFNKARHNRPTPHFTGLDGSLFFAPGDIAVEYDLNSSYNAGNTGSGQTIAIVGQSQIVKADIEAFQSASGLPIKDPMITPVPSSGDPTVQADGDETESDIDLEWAGATAKGATINFVFVGGNLNYSVFDSIVYAIDNQIGTVISSSYGECEAELSGEVLGSGADVQTTMEAAFQQAALQGQTVVSAAGDDGATDCFQGNTSGNPSETLQDSLAVDYPGSSAYVTSVGGTEISQANSNYLTPGDGYWTNTNNSTDIVTSVLQYIPEQAWNEDSECGQADCLASGGGGASSLFAKPSWQTALTPADGHRDVPDISLGASIELPGYLFCSSDTTDWSEGQESSCTSGFRDSFSGAPTSAGGTSFAAPIFAGMVAIINQQQGYTAGQGLVNSTLYSLAGNAGTYASAFHDITSGNNDCPHGSGLCFSTVTGFAAGTGYDQVTGLGSVDFGNLVGAWPASTGPTLISTTTTVTASNTAPLVNTSDNFSISVTSNTGTTIPTGTVAITVDSAAPVTETLTANGTYTYSFTFTTAGSHTVAVTYSGDTTHAASTGTTSVTVTATSSGTGTFTLGATNMTVTQGSTGTSTITATPAGGYTGTIDLDFDTSNDNALQNLCYGFTNSLSNGDGTVVVSNATTAATTQLVFDTNAADCSSGDVRKTGMHSLRSRSAVKASNNPTNRDGGKSAPLSIAFAGLLLAGFLGRRARKFRTLASVIALVAIGLAVSACGGSSNSDTVSDPPKGTYTVTLTGTDSSFSTIPAANTSFTFTIQ